MLNARNLSGIYPALPTPVGANDALDAPALTSLLDWLNGQGVNGVVPLGGTGEYCSLARAERARTVRVCADAMGGRGPVIPGILDPGFHDAMDNAKAFAAEGADALLVLTPYYTNPTQAGVRDYFMRFADNSPLPILVYEIPYRTRIAVDPTIIHDLSRHERIIGMKACNLDMYHFLQVVAGVDESFAVLSGEDSLFPLHIAAGARGGIVVTANLLPRAWRLIFDLASSGHLPKALEAHCRLIPLMNMAFAETNPGPMKAVMDLVGVNAPNMLAPLVSPAPALVTRFREELERQLAAFERG